MEFWMLLFKIAIFLPFILFLFFISVKYGGGKLQQIQNTKYLKIMERLSLSKDNSILIVKIGEKAYVISSGNKGVEILMELPEEEIKKIEADKAIPQYSNLKDFYNKLKVKGRYDDEK